MMSFSRQKEILLLVFSLALAVVAAEVVLRIGYPQISDSGEIMAADPVLGWQFRKNKTSLFLYAGGIRTSVKTSSMGFRDAEFPAAEKSESKIMVLGDSFVSNLAVAEEKMFTELLQEKLKHTEVMNLGVNGYSTVQEFLLLKKLLPIVRPDLIVWMIYIRNDFDENTAGNWGYTRPVARWNGSTGTLDIIPPSRQLKKDRPGVFTRFFQSLHLYHCMHFGFRALLARINGPRFGFGPAMHTAPELYLCCRESNEKMREKYRIMKEVLLEIDQYSKKMKTPILFALAPSAVQVEEDRWRAMLDVYGLDGKKHDREKPNDFLMGIARDHNLEMIDLLPGLAKATRDGSVLYNTVEQHWNERGNQQVAELLYLAVAKLVFSPATPLVEGTSR